MKTKSIKIFCLILSQLLLIMAMTGCGRITHIYHDDYFTRVADADNGWIYYISENNYISEDNEPVTISTISKMDTEGNNVSEVVMYDMISGIQVEDETIYFLALVEKKEKPKIFRHPNFTCCEYGLYMITEEESAAARSAKHIFEEFDIESFYVNDDQKIAMVIMDDPIVSDHNLTKKNWLDKETIFLELSNGRIERSVGIKDFGDIVFVGDTIIDVNPDGISQAYFYWSAYDYFVPLFMFENKIYLNGQGSKKDIPSIIILDKNQQSSVHYLNEIPKNQMIDRAIVLGNRIILNTSNKNGGKGEKLFELNPETLEVEEIVSLSGQEVIFAVTDKHLVTYKNGKIYKSAYGNGSLERKELANISKDRIKRIYIGLAENWMFLYEISGDGIDEEMILDLKYKINLETDEVVKDG